MGRKKIDLETKLEKAMMSAIEKTADQISYEIQEEYKTVIDEFYASYYPRSYERTFSTYLASDGAGSGLLGAAYGNNAHATQSGDIFTAGINVDSNNIPGDPYRADKDWVFERTFVLGYHGYTKKEWQEWRSRYFSRFRKRGDEFVKLSKTTKHKFSYYGTERKVYINGKFDRFEQISNNMTIGIRPESELRKRLKKKGALNESSNSAKKKYIGKIFNEYMTKELKKIKM